MPKASPFHHDLLVIFKDFFMKSHEVVLLNRIDSEKIAHIIESAANRVTSPVNVTVVEVETGSKFYVRDSNPSRRNLLQ